jgi:hypothetical protein
MVLAEMFSLRKLLGLRFEHRDLLDPGGQVQPERDVFRTPSKMLHRQAVGHVLPDKPNTRSLEMT